MERRGEEEKERGGETNRFDSVTSQAKRTEDKRKNRASEGQKQHPAPDRSLLDRSLVLRRRARESYVSAQACRVCRRQKDIRIE